MFLKTSMSDKLNLMVELRRKCASRVIQRWAINTKRKAVVRSTLQVLYGMHQGTSAI